MLYFIFLQIYKRHVIVGRILSYLMEGRFPLYLGLLGPDPFGHFWIRLGTSGSVLVNTSGFVPVLLGLSWLARVRSDQKLLSC